MICKKCSAKDSSGDTGTHKCTVEHCKFNIPREHQVCLSHSRRLDLCQCCGKPIGQTRRKGSEASRERR